MTEYPGAFRILAQEFDRLYIITINHAVTPVETERLLGRRADGIYHCPDEAVIDDISHVWKADICQQLHIDLMFDDDPNVIDECRQRGIAGIVVSASAFG